MGCLFLRYACRDHSKYQKSNVGIAFIDTDTDNCFIVATGVYIVKYIFKSWNIQQLKLSYKRPTFTL